MSLKIYLIRHGETDFNKQGKEWGQDKEASLNEWGISQSNKLAERLENIKFDKLFSSDLKRAIQTSQIIGKICKVKIIPDKRLREYEPGEVDPSSEKWMGEYKRLLNSGMSRYEIRPFGGENIWDLIKRVKSFLEDIEKEKGTICIVSHSGFNAAFINLSQNKTKNEFQNIKQDSACINFLEFSEGKWEIKIINDSEHISHLKPQKKNYDNQKEIKNIAKKYVFEKLDSSAKKIYLSGDIITGKFGFYDRPYKRYRGSTIEVYIVPLNNFEIPQKWKVSLINKDIKKYEVGEIIMRGVKHKVNVTIIDDLSKIKEGKERLK